MQTEHSLNADTHANACWLRLVAHAQAGRCTCHLGFGGSVNVLGGCSVGRMLKDEYERAKEAVKARAAGADGAGFWADATGPSKAEQSTLEAGDFDPSVYGESP